MRTYIKDLKPGAKITEYFVVKSKRIRTTRTNKPFLDLDLCDNSGQINAKVWNDADRIGDTFTRGDVVKVMGMVDEFQGQNQLKVEKLRPLNPDDEIDWADLIRTSPHDVGEMMDWMKKTIETVENPDLKSLLDSFFSDPDFVDAFMKAAAARNIHHVYAGGLLEHTMQVTKISLFSAEELYPGEVDRDLLVAGAILHDVGKIRELSAGAEIGYTTEGYLLGHITIGADLIKERARTLEGFPEELLMEILHIVISHHGEKEWGSPVVPMTPEALIVHGADNLDAKTRIALTSIADDPNEDEEFTQYHRTLGRHFYKAPGHGDGEE